MNNKEESLSGGYGINELGTTLFSPNRGRNSGVINTSKHSYGREE